MTVVMNEKNNLNPKYALEMHILPGGSDDPLSGGCQTAIESSQLTKTSHEDGFVKVNS